MIATISVFSHCLRVLSLFSAQFTHFLLFLRLKNPKGTIRIPVVLNLLFLLVFISWTFRVVSKTRKKKGQHCVMMRGECKLGVVVSSVKRAIRDKLIFNAHFFAPLSSPNESQNRNHPRGVFWSSRTTLLEM